MQLLIGITEASHMLISFSSANFTSNYSELITISVTRRGGPVVSVILLFCLRLHAHVLECR